MATPKKKYNYYVKKEKRLEPFNEKTKKSAYKPEWEQLDDFRGLISKSDLHFNRAKCLACQKDIKLTHGKHNIYTHFKSSLHMRNTSKFRWRKNGFQKREDLQTSQEVYEIEEDVYEDEAILPDYKEPICQMDTELNYSLNYSDNGNADELQHLNSQNYSSHNYSSQNYDSQLQINETVEIEDSDSNCESVQNRPESSTKEPVPSETTKVDQNLRLSDAESIDPSSTTFSNFESLKIKQAHSIGEMVANEMKGITNPKILAKFKSNILQIVCDLNSGKL
ncbi:hypothetical protein ACFFRR_010705 [Megaselia abdita]